MTPRRYDSTASPQGPWSPSDVLFVVLTSLTLLSAALVAGGLLAAPFGP